jgi:hypothetical protein
MVNNLDYFISLNLKNASLHATKKTLLKEELFDSIP